MIVRTNDIENLNI